MTDPDPDSGGDTDPTGDPNPAVACARAFVDELVASGVSAVCVAPGSRSTPLVFAADACDDLHTFSHLDERSAAFFALGRARRSGEPTAVLTTSGTAAAELHPAVLEADAARVPLVALTADRPPVRRDSGANQTVDQEKLYGDAVRWYRDAPEPALDDRTLRRFRVDAARAASAARGPPAGPVHCNLPFAKPLEPTGGEATVSRAPGAAPSVVVERGRQHLDDAALADLASVLRDAGRGLVVCGPARDRDAEAVTALADAVGFPVLADPLSGVRFGPHVADAAVPILGGYDAYLDERVTENWPAPDVVLRVGASPTSKPLRRYLARTGARQYHVDPAGGWREAEFAATDLLVADPASLAWTLADRLDRSPATSWHERLRTAEARHFALAADADPGLEGRLLASVVERAPDPATLVVSNSMPVRDLDRFGAPADRDLTVLGNRGASGIDGVTSTALGAGSATDDPLVAVLGDLAAYHDANGLLAVDRCDVPATIVVVNNDGGGIFHALPVAEHDPPFTEQFRTPHGLTFEHLAAQYGLSHEAVEPGDFADAYGDVVGDGTATLLEVRTDAAASHERREALRESLVADLTG
ncbi:MAG: 2-succinyl-5-enolpyruvyl-6-hydroxy-3-cyclohexene-1-carboxylic-acid synthase [Halobacteriaceae archaeon]